MSLTLAATFGVELVPFETVSEMIELLTTKYEELEIRSIEVGIENIDLDAELASAPKECYSVEEAKVEPNESKEKTHTDKKAVKSQH